MKFLAHHFLKLLQLLVQLLESSQTVTNGSLKSGLIKGAVVLNGVVVRRFSPVAIYTHLSLFTLPRQTIDLKSWRHFLNQSEVKPEPFVGRSHTFFPRCASATYICFAFSLVHWTL